MHENEAPSEARHYCNLPPVPVRELPAGLPLGRASLIVENQSKWLNGTVLHYYFFDQPGDKSTVQMSDGSTRDVPWTAPVEQQEAVREAFQAWVDIGIGLRFEEVKDRHEAEVRIGFAQDDGSWSYIGREILKQGANERTMNFGWDLTTEYGATTARHEIGHTIGMPHEHQNPYAGIVWDEPKVLAYFAGPPNSWSQQETQFNVLQKLSTSEVSGSTWDPDSIMEYWFPAGLIKQPARYQNGLHPPGTISAIDRKWVATWYPKTAPTAPPTPTLVPFQSVKLDLKPRQQVDFTLTPAQTRVYDIGTFGFADTVLGLFETIDGQPRFLAADDDSGTSRNARISAKLFKGRTYTVRLRLYWAGASGSTALMCW